MSDTADRILKIRDIGVFRLAKMADCAAPDSSASPGGVFLASVREAVADRLKEESSDTDYVSPADWQDAQREIANAAPDVMIHERWRQFIDLAAYREPSGSEGWASADLTEIAAEALSQIAYRLAGELMTCDDTGEIVTECDGCAEHARCEAHESRLTSGESSAACLDAGLVCSIDPTTGTCTECGHREHAPVCPRCGIRERHEAGGNLCQELGGR